MSSIYPCEAKKRKLRRDQYTVGWLCALPKSELVAAMAMLDEEHDDCPVPPDDMNIYTYGSIAGHNVVIACMPPNMPGTVSAAVLAAPLAQSFPNMKIHLFVGIGGGCPSDPPQEDPCEDVHLGDVVVGWAEANVPGVIPWDLRRWEEDGNDQLLGRLDKPDRRLLSALGKLLANYRRRKTKFDEHLQNIPAEFSHPGLDRDNLYKADYHHPGSEYYTCVSCDKGQLVSRPPRLTTQMVFHEGTVLSGSSVIKTARERDRLSKKYYNAKCIEMEAAGVTDLTHCLVIRGISDYCDSHKNHMWQPYAAATAAAFAKEFLRTIPHSDVDKIPGLSAALEEVQQQHQQQTEQRLKEHQQQTEQRRKENERLENKWEQKMHLLMQKPKLLRQLDLLQQQQQLKKMRQLRQELQQAQQKKKSQLQPQSQQKKPPQNQRPAQQNQPKKQPQPQQQQQKKQPQPQLQQAQQKNKQPQPQLQQNQPKKAPAQNQQNQQSAQKKQPQPQLQQAQQKKKQPQPQSQPQLQQNQPKKKPAQNQHNQQQPAEKKQPQPQPQQQKKAQPQQPQQKKKQPSPLRQQNQQQQKKQPQPQQVQVRQLQKQK